MENKRLSQKVKITKTGAILLAKHVACDGTDVERGVGFLSHAHSDHLKEFESALSYHEAVLVSNATRDLLIADKGNWLLRRRNLIGLPYERPFTYKSERITLFPANHMLGSSQVLLEDEDGVRIVYTGDFNYPNTPVLDADILVMEATYGDPHDIMSYTRKNLINKIVSLVKEGLRRGKPAYIFSWSGKLQCLMNIFTSEGVDVPFLALPKDVKMAEIYRKYGMNVGNVHEIGTREAYEIQKSQPFVAFHRIGSTVREAESFLSIRVSACMAREGFYEARKNYYVAALSDHADFNGLLEYVKQSKPKLVITDNSRCGKALTLAREIKKRLDIDAKPLPL
jgi:putative mRNA 3-end processing factor